MEPNNGAMALGVGLALFVSFPSESEQWSWWSWAGLLWKCITILRTLWHECSLPTPPYPPTPQLLQHLVENPTTAVSPWCYGNSLCPFLLTLEPPWIIHTQCSKVQVTHSCFYCAFRELKAPCEHSKGFQTGHVFLCECSNQFTHLFPDVFFCSFPDWLTGDVHRALRLGFFSHTIHRLEKKRDHWIKHPQELKEAQRVSYFEHSSDASVLLCDILTISHRPLLEFLQWWELWLLRQLVPSLGYHC